MLEVSFLQDLEREGPNSVLIKNKWFTFIIRHQKIQRTTELLSQRSHSNHIQWNRRVYYCCLCHHDCTGTAGNRLRLRSNLKGMCLKSSTFFAVITGISRTEPVCCRYSKIRI